MQQLGIERSHLPSKFGTSLSAASKLVGGVSAVLVAIAHQSAVHALAAPASEREYNHAEGVSCTIFPLVLQCRICITKNYQVNVQKNMSRVTHKKSTALPPFVTKMGEQWFQVTHPAYQHGAAWRRQRKESLEWL